MTNMPQTRESMEQELSHLRDEATLLHEVQDQTVTFNFRILCYQDLIRVEQRISALLNELNDPQICVLSEHPMV